MLSIPPSADRGINTFSPEGRLFQVEYSLEAIKLGSTAIGVATSDGVVLGVEKRVTSTLLETSSVEKIVEIDRHIGCAMSGLQADARSMVEHARVECQSHGSFFVFQKGRRNQLGEAELGEQARADARSE